MRTQAMIKAKRAHDKAEAQSRLLAAREQFRVLPEIEKIDLRTGTMRELLADVRDLDAIITCPPEDCIPPYGELAVLASAALKPDGQLAVMCGPLQLPQVYADMTSHMRYRWTMVYLTPDAQAVQRYVAVYWQGDKAKWKWIGDVVKGDMEKLVDRLTQPGQLICDPYLGRGDIAAACVSLCRRIVGCDVDEVRVEKVRSRTSFLLDCA